MIVSEEVQQSNVLVNQFVGGGYTPKIQPFYDERWVECPFGIEMIQDLQYHTSWDWLMKALSRITELGYVWHITSSHTFSKKWVVHTFRVKEDKFVLSEDTTIIKYASDYSNNESELSAVYQGVIKFIEWYNAQKVNN